MRGWGTLEVGKRAARSLPAILACAPLAAADIVCLLAPACACLPSKETDTAPTLEECARAVEIVSLLESPCDWPAGACEQPSFDAGVLFECVPNNSPLTDAGADSGTATGCCWLRCDNVRWPGTGCPPAMFCTVIFDACQKNTSTCVRSPACSP